MRGLTLLTYALVLPGLFATRGTAQERRPLAGRVTGARGAPVAGAHIEVAGTFWSAVSRADGRFLLAVPPGSWDVRVRRIGYQPASRTILVPPDTSAEFLHVELAEAPRELRGVVVKGAPDVPMASTVTPQTVRHVPPFGEPDVFRLLPLLPAVSQPNDLIGRVHFAGGASDEHGVYLDGHPLQAPFHVLSVLGAFNVAALSRADVLIHHLPSSVNGHLSGAINLESRQPAGRPEREAVVSLLSASLTGTQPRLYADVYALGSARVTFMDKLLRIYRQATSATSDDLATPSYRDALFRVGRSWAGGWTAEALGYQALDHAGTGRSGPGHVPARWGENLIGVRGIYESPSWRSTIRLSTDRAFVRFRQAAVGGGDGDAAPQPVEHIYLDQDWKSGSADVRYLGRRWRPAVGIRVDDRRHTQAWRGPEAEDWFKAGFPYEHDGRQEQRLLGLFGEAAFISGTWWDATAGVHVSLLGGRTYVAPRFLLGATLSDALRVELAANRRQQFHAIAAEPIEGSIMQPTFLLRRPREAETIAALASWRPAGVQMSRRTSLEVALYARRYRERTLLEERTPSRFDPPASSDPAFPAFRRVPGATVGGSLTLEHVLGGGALIRGTYTAQSARERADGDTRPVAWDAPHSVALFAGVPLGARWALTSAAQFRSGTAVTPVEARILQPFGLGQYAPRFIYGKPNSARLPAYHRIDLGARRSWRSRGVDWAWSLQVLNVLGRRNALEYGWDAYFFCLERPACPRTATGRRGLPVVPSTGIEARW